MREPDRFPSSNCSHLSINFRTAENDKETLEKLKNFQRIFLNNVKVNKTVKLDLHYEDRAIFVYLKTNLCKQRLKLLVDTGASLSLLNRNKVAENVKKTDYIVNLYGIVGKDVSVKTEGFVNGLIEADEHVIATTLHLVDEKYKGPGDGYLGFDFLASYFAIIDMNNMKLVINLSEAMRSRNGDEVKPNGEPDNTENEVTEETDEATRFLNCIALFYEHECEPEHRRKEERLRKIMDDCRETLERKQEYEDYETYQNTVEQFQQKFEKINELKVNPDLERDDTQRVLNLDVQNPLLSRSDLIFQELKLDDCTEEEKAFIKEICESFPYQFYVEGDVLAATDVIKNEIKLVPNAGIVNVRQYRIPQAHRDILQEIVEEHERQGIIERCQSKFNSPALLVPKKDGVGGMSDYRFVVDYKKLNQVTEIENFPIPDIEPIIYSFDKCRFYSTLDVKGAYHQIEMAENSMDYTAFTVGPFQYRWRRMPFGLSTSPRIFQRCVNTS